jgi:hypothetical protein
MSTKIGLNLLPTTPGANRWPIQSEPIKYKKLGELDIVPAQQSEAHLVTLVVRRVYPDIAIDSR